MSAATKTRRPIFRQADVKRAIDSVRSTGLAIKSVEFTVDGAFRVLTQAGDPGVAVNENVDWVSDAGAAQDDRRP